MRILHVNKFIYRRGGAETYMLDVAALQRQAGHTVELWGMNHPDNIADLPLQDTFAPFIELESAPGGLANITAGARMVWSPASGTGLARALRRFKPDLVHLHNIYHQLSPSVLRPIARAGIPAVMTLHDYKLACPNYQLLDHGNLCERCVTGGTWNAAKQRCKGGSLGGSALLSIESGIHRATNAYDSVDMFSSPSEFLRDVMLRRGIAPERIAVVPNVVDVVVRSAPIQPHDAGPGSVQRFLFAGRLAHEKGVDTLIEAMRHTPDGIRLDIAGDGPERARLTALAESLAPGRVTFHGRLGKTEVAQLLEAATASVVPSRWYENQPMTILEAFAAGVPVIGTALGGIPEMIQGDAHGAVVPHDDPAALAAAMTSLAQDPEGTAAKGRRAREFYTERFDAEAHLRRLGEVYEAAARHRANA